MHKSNAFDFQESQGSICLSDVEMHVEITIHKLSQCHNNTKFIKVNNFKDMKKLAAEETLNLPTSSRLRAPAFCFDKFKNDLFSKFNEGFMEELNKAFPQIKFWSNFSILPKDLPSSEAYGHVELDNLVEHYGNC